MPQKAKIISREPERRSDPLPFRKIPSWPKPWRANLTWGWCDGSDRSVTGPDLHLALDHSERFTVYTIVFSMQVCAAPLKNSKNWDYSVRLDRANQVWIKIVLLHCQFPEMPFFSCWESMKALPKLVGALSATLLWLVAGPSNCFQRHFS